ncbi:unnamed protein product [Leptosia nina]|uniref:Uncharacterized protein n=1 Tax=Leptosia nina TaxID=320188 RepID=A0AAV1K651_9NEOP
MEMDTDCVSLPETCENLMINVVETRKHFGKKCLEYHQKTAQVEHAMLNLQLKAISNSKLPKSKHQIPNLPYDKMIHDMDDFKEEILAAERKLHAIDNKIMNTEKIVTQIINDRINKQAKIPITTESLIACAKV